MRFNVLIVIAVVAVLGAASAQMLFAGDKLEWPDDDTVYTEKQLPAYMFTPEDKDRSSITVRYYGDEPSVPYVSVADYYMKLQGYGISVRHLGEGLFELSNDRDGGGKARLDTVKGTLTSDDYGAFAIVRDQYDSGAGLDNSLIRTLSEKDLNTSGKVTVDLGRYGIGMHTDRDSGTVWLPLPTVADLFISPNNYYASYVGDAVYFIDSDTMSDYNLYLKDKQYMAYIDAFMGEDRTRPADLIEYSYGELCMLFDSFYGRPGLGAMSAMMAEKGLDGALASYSDASRTIRSYLRSADYGEYCAGLWKLSSLIYDGGHTQTALGPGYFVNYLILYTYDFGLPDRIQDLADAIPVPESPDMGAVRDALTELRKQTWDFQHLSGGARYYEQGDTAVFSFDKFDYDDAAWVRYLESGGDLPDDSIGQMYVALGMASGNPDIRNFLVDLTTNTGGRVSVVVFMNALMSADDVSVQQYDTRTGLAHGIVMASDINLDGKFDEKDHVRQFDLNYGILTSAGSFSCGNYLPVTAQMNGIMILGETSGGGSCTVSMATVPGGLQFTMSSYNKLIAGYGEEGFDVDAVEKGAAPDAVLVTVDDEGNADYSGIYDLETISQRMQEFYSAA